MHVGEGGDLCYFGTQWGAEAEGAWIGELFPMDDIDAKMYEEKLYDVAFDDFGIHLAEKLSKEHSLRFRIFSFVTGMITLLFSSRHINFHVRF